MSGVKRKLTSLRTLGNYNAYSNTLVRPRNIGPVLRSGHFVSGRGYKRSRISSPYSSSLMALQGRGAGGRGVSETKFVDSALSTSTFIATTTPPTAVSLIFPVQGAAAFNRVGQKISLRSLRIRGNIFPNSTGTLTLLRVLIVYDKQANAALPVWTDVILGVNSAGAASSTITDGINMANRDRFIVLADEQINAPAFTNTAGVLTNLSYPQEKNPSMFNFDRFIPLKDMEMHFNNTNGGTFADIQTGSVSIFFAMQGTGTAASWQMTWSMRCRFRDY